MEILKDKKVLIGGLVVLALAGYWYWSKHKAIPTVTTDTTSTGTTPPATVTIGTTGKTRQQVVDLLYTANNLSAKNIPATTYDQFSDAELAMMYDVDINKTGSTPEYIVMLQKHGWA